ncbi:proton-coupled zinc antiporter SLC30A1-like [Paramacrobiotus metropolitanus]|uniref:proton-coupled zinc antiporter SLC30A1-like n=1 Tax=Paramacrobiotus metropolitanus TaxID=2943436 RepID=UPI002445DBFF|nr:proton-coupled zinc antiporter SLC30A1-like [Paramacrobiotus metropolitanus]
MKFGKTVRISTMLVLTGSLFFVELIVGYATNSMALVANSFHMLSDVMALTVGLLSVRIARKTSEKNTFGWARMDVLGALINAVFLCALCFSIVLEALHRFTEDVDVESPELVLIVGAVGLAVNIIGLVLFHGHGHQGHGHSHGIHSHADGDVHTEDLMIQPDNQESPTPPESPFSDSNQRISNNVKQKQPAKTKRGSHLNMYGLFLHVAGDALGSVVVIIAALVIWLTDWKYKHYIDPALSLVTVVVILVMTIPLLRSSSLILLQTVPLHMKAKDLKERLEKLDGVLAVHELHIWQLAGNKIVASAHVWCGSYPEYQRAASRIKQFFHDEGIHSTTIQAEFNEVGNNYENNIKLDPAFCGLPCPDSDVECAKDRCCQSTPLLHVISEANGGTHLPTFR